MNFYLIEVNLVKIKVYLVPKSLRVDPEWLKGRAKAMRGDDRGATKRLATA